MTMESSADPFLKLSKDIFLVVNPNGTLKEANAVWTHLLAWTWNETHLRFLQDFLHPEDRIHFSKFLEGMGAQKEGQEVDCRTAIQGGGYRWISYSGFFDSNRQLYFLVGKDIHKQKDHADFAKLFFESSSVGLNLCQMDGTWVESNPAFLKMIGYSKEEADGGLTYWQLTPKKYEEMEQLQLESLRDCGKYGPYEKEFIRKDGSRIPVRLNGFIIKKEGQPYIWSIIEDISHERQLKQEIEAKTSLFKAIIENLPTPLYLKDIKNKFNFVLWNAAAEELFDIPKEGILGKPSYDLWPRNLIERYHAEDLKVVQERHLVEIQEEPIQTSNRGTIYLHSKKVPLTIAEDSEPSFLLCISEDITERKNLEINLRTAVKIRDEFLTIASHELKTPLTALQLQLQILCRSVGERSIGGNDKIILLAKKALESCKQLGVLINELLDITRIRTGLLVLTKRKVDLKVLVEEMVSFMSEEFYRSGSEIHVKSLQTKIEGWWDPSRMNQVISNLLSNAIKYGQGKPIEVTVGIDEPSQSACLLVQDHGMGIPKELHHVIFNRFERGISADKVPGLGLGLFIVRQVVEAHGGSIQVESSPGNGALFTVKLPIKFYSPGLEET